MRPYLLTTTASVLVAVLEEPGATIRDLARRCDKTERAVWQQLNDLEAAGLLRRTRQGRCNRYVVDLQAVSHQLRKEGARLLALAVPSQRGEVEWDSASTARPLSVVRPA